MTGLERILDRALYNARLGQPNPMTCLMEAERSEAGDNPRDACDALLAMMRAAGGSLVRWHEAQRRKPAETAALLEEALFQVQMAGA